MVVSEVCFPCLMIAIMLVASSLLITDLHYIHFLFVEWDTERKTTHVDHVDFLRESGSNTMQDIYSLQNSVSCPYNPDC